MTIAHPSPLRRFLGGEAAAGLVLIAAAACALAVANSAAAPRYLAVLAAYVGPLSVLHWINDAAMALFFLIVGLEIRRELVSGALADPRARRLPVVAAIAGMAVPALVYLGVAGGDPAHVRGWAIASATDIAFALGVLALLGRRVPASLRLFLATVAIVDDLGAVLVIALFYTDTLDPRFLAAAAAIAIMLWRLSRQGVTARWPYLVLGLLLWIAVYRSGVHATLAGVVLAFAMPLGSGVRVEHALRPWVAFAILPLFGFANAGVALGGDLGARLAEPVSLGVAAGLFAGKQAGVFGAVRIAVACGFARLPEGAGWWQLYGVALLCGIGFTMSLFIGALAFDDPARIDAVRIGVIAGSLLSALAGALVLRLAPMKSR